MMLVLTLLCRDEADILESMLRFHLAQGVDRIIATDNGRWTAVWRSCSGSNGAAS